MDTDNGSQRTARNRRSTGMRRAVAVAAAFLCLSTFAASEARAQETAGEEIRDEVHEAREARWHHPRLRLGVSGLGGGFVGATHGGVGGLALRVGVQFNDMVAVYLQGQGLVGEYVPDPSPTSIAGFAFHEAMLEVTLLDMIQLGAGPSLDVIWGCSATNAGAYCGRSGAFFGGDFRVAITAFHRGAVHRSGLVFSIDAHPTWVGDELLGTLLFGIGAELY